MHAALLAFHDDYLRYDFGESHALREERLLLAKLLMKEYGLIGPSGAVEIAPSPATDEDIMMVHEKNYLDVLKKLSRNPTGFSFSHGLGIADNPVFKGMYEAAAIQAGGTILCCEAVARGDSVRAFNMGGGFHHAYPSRASGFCLLNDIAIGIRRLIEKYGFKRIMYIDIDVHHADAIEAIFHEDQRVLNISLHEDGHYLFPGSGDADDIGQGDGTGFSVNVPLPPYTGDTSYLHAFNEIVLPLAESYKPEIIFTQLGADAHHADPLAHLNVTTRMYEDVASAFDKISQRFCKRRWIAVTGGGYDIINCPRLWTLMFSKMVGMELSNSLPAGWMELCKATYSSVPEGGSLRDISSNRDETTVSRAVAKVVDEVKGNVFRYHGL